MERKQYFELENIVVLFSDFKDCLQGKNVNQEVYFVTIFNILRKWQLAVREWLYCMLLIGVKGRAGIFIRFESIRIDSPPLSIKSIRIH